MQEVLDKVSPKLSYDKLFQYWLEANSQPTPSRFLPIQEYNNYPAYWMDADNMLKYVYATSPEELYLKNKTKYPTTFDGFDYPTTAINLQSEDLYRLGVNVGNYDKYYRPQRVMQYIDEQNSQ